MYAMEKNTAEKLAETREVKTWKSHVNATIQPVHSQFGNLCQATPLAWPANRGQIAQSDTDVRPRRRRIDCEVPKTELVPFAFMLPSLRR